MVDISFVEKYVELSKYNLSKKLNCKNLKKTLLKLLFLVIYKSHNTL